MITKKLRRYIDKCVEKKVRRIFRDETTLQILEKFVNRINDPKTKLSFSRLIEKAKKISPKSYIYEKQDFENVLKQLLKNIQNNKSYMLSPKQVEKSRIEFERKMREEDERNRKLMRLSMLPWDVNSNL